MSVPLSEVRVAKGSGVMKVITPQKTFRFVFGTAFESIQGEYIGEQFASEITKRLPSPKPGQAAQVTIKTSPKQKSLPVLFALSVIGFGLFVILVIALFG